MPYKARTSPDGYCIALGADRATSGRVRRHRAAYPQSVVLVRGGTKSRRNRRYDREKAQGQRTDLTCGKNYQKSTTAQKLADEYGVSEATSTA